MTTTMTVRIAIELYDLLFNIDVCSNANIPPNIFMQRTFLAARHLPHPASSSISFSQGEEAALYTNSKNLTFHFIYCSLMNNETHSLLL